MYLNEKTVNHLQLVNMSAKLLVHKICEENKLQTLKIIIDDNKTTFGTWIEGSEDRNNKYNDKPRLIVKVVSEVNSSEVDLDLCARHVENSRFLFEILQEQFKLQQIYDTRNIIEPAINGLISANDNEVAMQYSGTLIEDHMQKFGTKELRIDKKYHLVNPLEYSLEKVKENNARIMENIHMLNKTLNYAKEKEILGMINPKLLGSYPCEECGKCFVYETGLRRHCSIRHATLDAQQRWQFVWTCTECFQVWPRQDLALKHANQCCKSDNTDYAREIKTSLLLQCEFCEKVYTNIPRLLKHLKTHNVIKNYECNACNIAFTCYKTAEQHWVLCLWLKKYYQFSLPKLLLCNSCDRKFRNYEQLYNHRYKVGHFIPKFSQSDNNSCMHVPTLVFQCEICGQWFNAISQIQDHRNQYHPHFNSNILYNNQDSIATPEI